MEKGAVYYERGEKNRGQPRLFEGHRGVFMEYRVDLEKNATDRVFWRKSWDIEGGFLLRHTNFGPIGSFPS